MGTRKCLGSVPEAFDCNTLERAVPRVGDTMPEIENLHDISEDCLELDDSSGFQEEDIALEAFGLLTANNYDGILAHALGVSL